MYTIFKIDKFYNLYGYNLNNLITDINLLLSLIIVLSVIINVAVIFIISHIKTKLIMYKMMKDRVRSICYAAKLSLVFNS